MNIRLRVCRYNRQLYYTTDKVVHELQTYTLLNKAYGRDNIELIW